MALFTAGKSFGALATESADLLNDNEAHPINFHHTPAEAVSDYNERFAPLIPGQDIVYKLVPYRIRMDKNGKIRLGKRVK